MSEPEEIEPIEAEDMEDDEVTFHFMPSNPDADDDLVHFGRLPGVLIELRLNSNENDVLMEVTSLDVGPEDLATMFEMLAASLRSITPEEIQRATEEQRAEMLAMSVQHHAEAQLRQVGDVSDTDK